jgi:hypothetical protein
MVKSFLQFINEDSNSKSEFIKSLAIKLIQKIKNSSSVDDDYHSFSGIKFNSPFTFNLILNICKTNYPNFKNDQHFKSLPWEEINYKKYGYSIDANTIKNKDSNTPSIEIFLLINPKEEPHLYTKLYSRLLDILTHETNHLDQLGVNTDPFSANPSMSDIRNSAKRSYKYFLLPDEIESMVEGMYVSSKEQHLPLDEVFNDYLFPFIKSKYITKGEYLEVITAWIKFALEKYPDANFSNKVAYIINSI